jgi:hypothetical protein
LIGGGDLSGCADADAGYHQQRSPCSEMN